MKRSAIPALAALLGVAGWKLWERLHEADLRGRVAAITGGSRGLGFLLARAFAREGCAVAICAREERELEEARAALTAEGAMVEATPCDVADRTQVDRWIGEVRRRLGDVDICVNNAGIIDVGPLRTMTVEDFERAMGVMFWGTLYPTLAVLPGMLQRGWGAIVNVTSIGGKVSVPHLLPYGCAKFAAVGFSEGLHAELAPSGIRVLTVVPGLMRTGSHLRARFKGRQEAEFGWFSLGASLPGVSIAAEHACRLIVAATKRGKSEIVLGLPAEALMRVQGLMPGATIRALSLVNRLLPGAPSDAGTDAALGWDLRRRMAPSPLTAATALGTAAADRFHQRPPEPPGARDE